MSERLQRVKTRKIDKFVRICDRAETLMSTEGSVTQLNTALSDIGELFEEIVSINDELIDQGQSTKEHELDSNGVQQLHERYKTVSQKMKLYLESRASDNRSEMSLRTRSVARSQVSNTSRASNASKEAEISARLRRIQLQQLERRLERECELEQRQTQQHEMERAARLAEAQDAMELAAVEAELRKTAENDLVWNRFDDFAGEAAVIERNPLSPTPNAAPTGKQQSHTPLAVCSRLPCAPPPEAAMLRPSNACTLSIWEQPARPLPQETPRPKSVSDMSPIATEQRQLNSRITSWITEAVKHAEKGQISYPATDGARRSVPQIQLPKFSGKSIEWPQWAGLFKTLIHDQPDLSDAEKLAHLQSSVTGVAKQTVEGMLFDGSL